MISYEKLFKKMAEKNISQYSLEYDYGISRGLLTRLRNNQSITTNSLDILCNILECNVGDIADHIKDNNNYFGKKKSE